MASRHVCLEPQDCIANFGTPAHTAWLAPALTAELVLPVAIGDPGIDHVGVFRTPDGLGEVECQTDRLGVDFDDSRGKIACSFMHY